jgi:hypothetical protein
MPAKFTSALIEGDKGVTALIVPFDPVLVWDAKPTELDPRREGWLVSGTLNGVAFEGWIGLRWKRYFIIVDAEAIGAVVGDSIDVVVEPTTSATALAIAREQAKLTTAPRKPRARVVARPRR